MEDYYRRRHQPQRVVFDPVMGSLWRGRSRREGDDVYRHIKQTGNVTSNVTSKAQKICIAVFCVCAVVGVVTAAVVLGFTRSAAGDSSDVSSNSSEPTTISPSSTTTMATTGTAATSTSTQMPTASETVADTQSPVLTTTMPTEGTTIKTTTTKPAPEYNVTATTITYTFENTFPKDVVAAEYTVYVSTNPDKSLLNDSVTWAMVQGAKPPYAYVALKCSDFFVNDGCLNSGTRKKRQVVDQVITQIGIEKCDQANPATICNGELQSGITYYLLVQLTTATNTLFDNGFSIALTTGLYGQWSVWGGWGSCDLSCGGGIQRRTRTCEGSDFCVGSASTSQRCNFQACPVQVLAGSWLTWSSWTECTVTCGEGVQARSRQCDRGIEDLNCLGGDSQTIDCNSWVCPDCSMTCTSGYLSDSCTHCECHGEFEGIVQSSTGLALNNVHISISDIPYMVLNTTLSNGHYVLEKLCVFHTLLFHKEGYSSQSVEAYFIPNIIQLEGQESLTIDLHPTSKKRVVGDDVLFCCAAIGNPLPQYYEWFKNGLQIAGETGSTLSLISVILTSAGSYRCRANTDTQGIYSLEATLTVKENADDFCPESTESKFQQLPSGCLYNNETVIDIGDCANLRCRGDSVSNETCSDQETFCCAATQFETVDMECEDFRFSVYKTTACGCSKCTTPVLDIQGFVLAAEDNSPLANVAIYYNKSVVAETASNGQFYFNIPEGTRRVSIIAKPNNSSKYADGIGVLNLNEDADGVYYTTIKLAKVIILDPIDATEDQVLKLGNGINTLVEVDIEANSFYDKEGNIFQDVVTPQVSVIESTSLDKLEMAPGDFTTVDRNGEPELLQTFGMVQMAFKSSDGENLQISKDIHMNVPAAILGQVDEDNLPGSSNPLNMIKLYAMNNIDAVWEEKGSVQKTSSDRRRKRQGLFYGVTVAGISPISQWFNFDAVSSTTCYSKIRIFGSEDFVKENQISGVQVFAFIKGNDDTYSFSTRLAYENDVAKGYCIVHRCDKPNNNNNDFKGYLVVKKDGKYLVPAVNNTGLGDLEETLEYKYFDDKLEVKYNMLEEMKGPFYDWKDKWINSPDCINADFAHKHFRFHLQKEDQCYQYQEFSFKADLTDTCKPEYYKLWYSVPETRAHTFTTCYIRVQIAQYTNSVKVQVFSRIGTFAHEQGNINPGKNYGFHENCTVGGLICIKLKPPGSVGCSTIPSDDKMDNHTLVSVTARYKTSGEFLNVSDVHAELKEEHTVLKEDSSFEFQMTSSGTVGGIFCKSGSKTRSNAVAIAECLAADEEQYAVKFGNSIKCGADVVLILDTSGSMSRYSTTNTNWMLQIPEYFPIGTGNIKASVILVYNSRSLLWNLNSQHTDSNENLQTALRNFPDDEAVIGYSNLGPALELAYDTVLAESQGGANKVIIMFWDGDAEHSSTVASFNDTRVLSVAPNELRKQNVESIVADKQKDMFYLDRNSTAEFVDHLRDIFKCE